MVAIFSTCKPFEGEDATRQLNALLSWQMMGQPIVLFGDDPGVEEAAERFGCIHVPDVECSEQGRPLISAMFREVQEVSDDDFFCYLNADNLVAGLPEAFERVAQRFPDFLLLGRRWDWGGPFEIEIGPRWWESLPGGSWHNEWALEYFGFTRGMFLDLLPFYAGWPGWDNWLVLLALRLGIPTVEVTEAVTCVHQSHPRSWRNKREDPQCRWNLNLAAGLLVPDARGSVDAAAWVLGEGDIRPRRGK